MSLVTGSCGCLPLAIVMRERHTLPAREKIKIQRSVFIE